MMVTLFEGPVKIAALAESNTLVTKLKFLEYSYLRCLYIYIIENNKNNKLLIVAKMYVSISESIIGLKPISIF